MSAAPPIPAAAPRRRRASKPETRPAERVRALARERFGIEHLREGQETVICRVLEDRPTIAIMPTGAGKSLCYQVPALLLPGTTVVVSPLIALMKDQCDKLRELGIAAVQLNSAVAAEELREAERAIGEGSARIVFTTPERLADPAFVRLLSSHPVSLLTVDEAHCISQWGHDFRPAFLEIGEALAPLGRPAVLALTATATQAVIDDIGTQLGVPDFGVVNTGIYRPNLRYAVRQVSSEKSKLAQVLDLVRGLKGSGIVYTATVKAAVEVHAALAEAGESVALYHGRLAAGARREHQDAFMSGQARVMVATNAFGLGVDKPDIRFVLHFQMPSGLDEYYQESGRAGRDGEPARCILLFLRKDRAVQQFFLAGKYPALEDVLAVYQALLAPPPEDGRGWTASRLQQALDRPKVKVQVALHLLVHERVVGKDREGRLRLKEAALEPGALERLAQSYRDKREADRAMLEQMVFYGQTGYCRWKVLLAHFREDEGFTRCGKCDNCARIEAAEEAREEAAAKEPDPLHQPRPEPQTTSAFTKGTTVRVPHYGRGVVEEADDRTVTVVFANGEKRCFLGSYVQQARRR